MKLIIIIMTIFSINYSLACRCAHKPLHEVVKDAKFILQVKVLASENNVTIAQVSKILKSTTTNEYQHINRVLDLSPIFVVSGQNNQGTSCPSTNVEEAIGTELIIFPDINTESVPFTLETNMSIGPCSFLDFININHSQAQEILRQINS